jgi:cytochrome c-type biogenesis protein CcmF
MPAGHVKHDESTGVHMPDLGLDSLRFALVVACAGIAAGIYAGIARRDEVTRVAERAVYVTCAFMSVAMLCLFWALATNDFSLAYVAKHSARSMALHYRLGALWGGQAGSLLLWGWMVAVYGSAALFANRNGNRTLAPWVAAILLGNAAFFLVLTNFVTIPFERLPHDQVLSDGTGLNPLLQHPVMMIHPLMLYTGFTGFAVPFAYALAALITGELDTTWFRTTRRWTLIAWTALSAGIILGGRWAYEVLGWGGYWAWDPVENASLMPWIAGTAYLHSVIIQEKRDMLRMWNVVLIGLTYGLCLFGTFLTRSGVVQSVHAFTTSSGFAQLFLGYVVLVLVLFFGFTLYRRVELRSPQRIESMVSREASFVLNNWAFMAFLVVVFWGTMLPVFSEAISGQRTTLGPKFFNQMAGLVSVALLLLTGVGPLVAWRRASSASLRRQFILPSMIGVATSVLLGIVFWGTAGFWAVCIWGLGAFIVAGVVQEYVRAISARMRRHGESPTKALGTLLSKNQRRYGGYVVHVGVVLIVVGFSGALFNHEQLENVRVGESVEWGDYRLEYLTADAIPEQHYGGATARLALFRDGDPLAMMEPERRIYWLEDQPSSIPSIYSTWREDIYVILNAIEADGSATLKIYQNPGVNWIWYGGILFVIGCFVIMWPHPETPLGKRPA